MMAELPEITEQCAGRWTQILAAIGIERSYLSGKHTPCIFCGGKDRARWDARHETLLCSQCGHKYAINAAMAYLGMDFKDTAAYIRENILGNTEKMKPTNLQKTDYEKNRIRLDFIKKGCVKITDGDPVDLYLKNRGISILPKQGVYYNPSVDYFESYLDEEGKKKYKKVGSYPAMVADLMLNATERATLKITYLTKDGYKANISEPKKTMPVERPMNGCAIRMFRVTDTIAISEGLETSSRFTEDTGIPCWGVDNAGNMENFIPPDGVKNVIVVADGGFLGLGKAFTAAYKIEAKGFTVNVVMIIKIAGKYEYYTETGDKIDYLDYCNIRDFGEIK